jgi:hypothetical protein
MKIEVYDTTLTEQIPADRYVFVVKDMLPDTDTWTMDVWYMSIDANMPNGVCSYAGDSPKAIPANTKRIQLGDLPKGTLVQIINLLVYLAS